MRPWRSVATTGHRVARSTSTIRQPASPCLGAARGAKSFIHHIGAGALRPRAGDDRKLWRPVDGRDGTRRSQAPAGQGGARGRSGSREGLTRAAGRTKARTMADVFEEWLRRDQVGQSQPSPCRASDAAKRVALLGERATRLIIRKRDIIEVADAIVDRGSPIMANQVLAHTKRLFRWAASRDLIEADPAAPVGVSPPAPSRSRALGRGTGGSVAGAADCAPRLASVFGY